MLIETHPNFLKIENENCKDCPKCNNKLESEIIKISILDGYECYRCRQDMRPYNYGKCEDMCTCQYVEVDCLKFTCKNCLNCDKCSLLLNYRYSKYNCISCDKIEIDKLKLIKKNKFNLDFKTLSPKDKLSKYGIIKLKILCKNKGLKKYSKLYKHQLIELLNDVVVNSDFPIKKNIYINKY
jgi:hypothetical protein